jgi:Ca2+-binding EF-hand superfamily protein
MQASRFQACDAHSQSASLARDGYHALLRAFRAFDPEGKGYVDGEQLKLMLAWQVNCFWGKWLNHAS